MFSFRTAFYTCVLSSQILSVSNAFATGGFVCSAKNKLAQKIEVHACVPHFGPFTLCSDVQVIVKQEDKTLEDFSIPVSQVSNLYLGKIAKGPMAFVVVAYDSDLTQPILSIEALFNPKKATDDSELISKSNLITSEFLLNYNNKNYSFSKLICEVY